MIKRSARRLFSKMEDWQRVRRACLATTLLLAGVITSGCGGGAAPPPDARDPEMLNAMAAGRQAFARGALDIAADQYRRSLRRARLQGDPPTIADQAYNLAVVLTAAGQHAEASAALDEAEEAAGAGNLPTADILLVRARVIYASANGSSPGFLESADAAALRVLEDPASKPTDAHRVGVAVLRAEIACDRRRLDAAVAQLTAARAIVARSPAAGGAGVFRAAGRVATLSNDHPAAAAAFDEEARLQRKAGRFTEMARAMSDAGRSHEQAGNLGVAAERYYRSAVSWAAQDRTAQAVRAAESARAAAVRAGDGPRLRLIVSLARTIERTDAYSSPSTGPTGRHTD
jgi:tetratricopeptide (TPR) repeat protein